MFRMRMLVLVGVVLVAIVGTVVSQRHEAAAVNDRACVNGSGVHVADRAGVNGNGVQVADRAGINGGGVQVADSASVGGAGLRTC